MDFKKLAPISLICTMVFVGCSFQKDPNKAAPEPVKVGMTKHELEDEILKMDSTSLPDRLMYALRKEDEALALKLVSEASDENINEYGAGGDTALELTIRYDFNELAALLLKKGASPYKSHRGTTFDIFNLIATKSSFDSDLKALLDLSDDKLFIAAKDALCSGPDRLNWFYRDTHFPFYKKVKDGKSVMDFAVECSQQTARYMSRLSCTTAVFDIFMLIVKAEKPNSPDWYTLARIGARTGTLNLLDYSLSSLGQLTPAERLTIFEDGKSQTLAMLSQIADRIEIADLDKIRIQEILMSNIQGREKRELRKDYGIPSVRDFLKEYPSVFDELYKRADGASVKFEVTNSDLPGGKILKNSNFGFEEFLNGQRYSSKCEYMEEDINSPN